MADQATREQSNKPCCKEDGKKAEKKLVKATELPIHGNPFPPKDCVQVETPGMIETKVRAARTTLQPYVSPFATAYQKTSDVISIGVAHSQSTIQRLAESDSSVVNAMIISTSGLLGYALARRGGFIKKILFTSTFFGGAMAVCYPMQAKEQSQIMWYIAKNKLPDAAKQQYEKLIGSKTE